MLRSTAERKRWLVILAVALLARLAAGVWWEFELGDQRRFFFGDSESYWELGRAIARGESYQYLSADARVFRMPGYPLLLAAVQRVFSGEPPVMAARALSAVLGTLAVAASGWWTTQLFDARAGRIAGWIAALYPGGVALGALVLSEAPFCPLMLAQLACWSLAWRAGSRGRAIGWAVGSGTLAAAAIYMRPGWLLFTPFAIAAGLIFAGNRGRQAAIGAGMCAALVLCLTPWWVCNARLTGHFVPTTLQVGASLYDALHAGATGASDMSFVAPIAARERAEAAHADGGETFEYRLDRRMTRESLDWAGSHPGEALSLAWTKFTRLWNVWPNEPAFRGWPVRLAMLLTYVPLLGLAVAGAWRYSGRGWPYVLACLPAVYLTLLHVVFVSSIRYREPAMLALTTLAAGVLAGATPRAVENGAAAGAPDPPQATA